MNLDRIPHYRSTLLLQGPVGPFFRHLAGFLEKRGSEVFKVNFNLGDDLFYRSGALHFRRSLSELPQYLNQLLDITGASAIFLFGDCRPIHRIAVEIAKARGVDVWVFEEGYIRPGFVTLEQGGANNNSGLPRDLAHYLDGSHEQEARETTGFMSRHGYWKMVWNGFLYFGAGALGKLQYPHYEHHKPLSLKEGLYWVRSLARKCLYKPGDMIAEAKVLRELAGKYFLVPLQVFNDASVTEHSCFASIESFITEVMESFAANAPANTHLVLKHHPMDRGYVQYGRHIATTAERLGVAGRVQYLHHGHVPSLIRASRGVVLINSTMGIQALYHGARVMVMGAALYDMAGITFGGKLGQFWTSRFRPNKEAAKRFREALIAQTQVGGNFYDRQWCKKVCDLGPTGIGALTLARLRAFGSAAVAPTTMRN